MQNNTFNSKIDDSILEKFINLPQLIENQKNSISSMQRSSFYFKGRKSSDIAEKIIQSMREESMTLCDPFFGSGTFPITASGVGLDVVGVELDNYTYDIVKTLHEDINLERLSDLYHKVKEDIFSDIMSLYETTCCNEKNYIKTLYFDPEDNEYYNPETHREFKDRKNIKLFYKCPICGDNFKKFESIDGIKLSELDKLDSSTFPSHDLIINSRINITKSTGANKYDRNFSQRNKIALLKLQESISKLENSVEKHVLQHALVSSLTLSKIVQYGSSSDILYHVIRSKAQDMNVWYIFDSKYNSIFRYIDSNKDISFDKLHLLNGDYKTILQDEKYIDYFDIIYTDPPYTDQVPYLERNQLYRDWLREFVEKKRFMLTDEMLKKEVVVSNAASRPEKNLDNYFRDINEMFKVFSRITKENGTVALTLNLGKNKFFKTLSNFIDSARMYGFEYVSRLDLEKSDPTLRKQSAWKNTLSKEMIVFFVKLSNEKAYWYYSGKNIELEIAKFVYHQILESNGITLTKACTKIASEIFDKSFNELADDQKNKIKKLLKEQFTIDERTAMVYINSDKLYVSIEDETTLFNKLYDIVPIMINDLLEANDTFTLQDLYFQISSRICNGDPSVLAQILEDEERGNHIKLLIENYCDLSDANVYSRKAKEVEIDPDAIDISVLDGYAFEDILKELLEQEGYRNVIRIGGAGDRGVDLRAKKVNLKTGVEEGYIFQSKRWIGNVGSEPIQRLHSMMIQYSSEIQHALCITTSDFTSHGKKEAESTGVIIINGKKLMERLNAAFPGKYYHGLLKFSAVVYKK